jgi:prepilin-type N-terminal cleavage/methylation domain-containing protein
MENLGIRNSKLHAAIDESHHLHDCGHHKARARRKPSRALKTLVSPYLTVVYQKPSRALNSGTRLAITSQRITTKRDRRLIGMKNEQGFSLVELLIVVAIIAIIAAIAVPSLLTSKQAANEAGAIQGCRTIGSAQIAYSATSNQLYTTLTGLVGGNFLDARFTGGLNGYNYAEGDVPVITSDGSTPTSFGFLATPDTGAGRYTYAIGPDQVVRWAGSTLPAGTTAGDPIGKN